MRLCVFVCVCVRVSVCICHYRESGARERDRESETVCFLRSMCVSICAYTVAEGDKYV